MFKKTLSSLSGLFSITDEQAMWRVQMDGDAQAFAVLMERWHDRIHGLCARMLSNVHTGEDIAQEVFARVFEKRKDYDPQKRFSTWLWRIAVNRCYDELQCQWAEEHFVAVHGERLGKLGSVWEEEDTDEYEGTMDHCEQKDTSWRKKRDRDEFCLYQQIKLGKQVG